MRVWSTWTVFLPEEIRTNAFLFQTRNEPQKTMLRRCHKWMPTMCSCKRWQSSIADENARPSVEPASTKREERQSQDGNAEAVKKPIWKSMRFIALSCGFGALGLTAILSYNAERNLASTPLPLGVTARRAQRQMDPGSFALNPSFKAIDDALALWDEIDAQRADPRMQRELVQKALVRLQSVPQRGVHEDELVALRLALLVHRVKTDVRTEQWELVIADSQEAQDFLRRHDGLPPEFLGDLNYTWRVLQTAQKMSQAHVRTGR